MICSNCGAHSPDGSQFCGQCGMAFTVQQAAPPDNPPPIQPNYGQPQQPVQPQQFAQPNIPVARKPLTPEKKKKIIIISACAAVLTAFIIVLFAAIIPNAGFKGKLRHVWSYKPYSSSYGRTLDLKSNTMTTGLEAVPISWKLNGNLLIITRKNNSNGIMSSGSSSAYACAITPDGKTLLLYDADDYEYGDKISDIVKYKPDYVYTRVD